LKRYYILHYFDPANVGSFLLVSLLGLILVLALVLLIAKLQIQRQLKEETEEKAKKIRRKKHQRRQYQIVESFYELVFSGIYKLHRRTNQKSRYLLKRVLR